MTETFDQYLTRRSKGEVGKNIIDNYSYVDYDNEIITFPLWSFTGQMIGFQRHDWKSDKKKRNDAKGKYWTYHKKEVLPVYGLEFYSPERTLYVVEGIWDAISCMNAGLMSIATLTNNPKHLKNLLSCIPNRKVAICDGDKAGKMLAKACDSAIILPEGLDCNDLTSNELMEVVNGQRHYKKSDQ